MKTQIPNTYVNKPSIIANHNILGLAGQRRVGKNYVASVLTSMDNRFMEMSFADSLKEDYAEEKGIDLFELHDPKYKEKHRRNIQEYSLDMKEKHGEFIFVNRMVDKLVEGYYYVVTDVRFLSELQTIILLGGCVYKVHADRHIRARRGWTYNPVVDEDISETEVGELSSDTLRSCAKGGFIYNTKEDDHNNIQTQLKEIIKAHFPYRMEDFARLNRMKDTGIDRS